MMYLPRQFALRPCSYGNGRTKFDSLPHRLYDNLKACPDITLAELSLVGSVEKLPTTTILVGGELTDERLTEAMQRPEAKK